MSVKSILVPMLVVMVVFNQCTKESLIPENKALNENQGLSLKAGELETTANNLSFPVIATDGFTLSKISENLWGKPYAGPYTGLTDAELAIAKGDVWYAQKEETNKWQADYQNSDKKIDVAFIDWGDVIESVNPKINHPFRIELTLYKNVSGENLQGYTMAVLANPSSANEIQGTNQETYSSLWATVASLQAGLTIQKFESGVTSAKWDDQKKIWLSQSASQSTRDYGFALELNVAGKYIYGTTSGGWRPTVPGSYRITFYLSKDSKINLNNDDIIIGNYAGNSAEIGVSETKGAEPIVDKANNLTYVDVNVVSESGSGNGGSGKGKGGIGSSSKGGMNKGLNSGKLR